MTKKSPSADEVVGQFDGIVDNRRIPDADVPTQYLEGVLDSVPDGYGYLRPKFSPSDKTAAKFLY